MNAADIIGYTADADTWCPECAAKLYPGRFTGCGRFARLFDPGWHDCGKKDKSGSPCHVEAFDGEGNEVHPIFGDSSDPCVCSRCKETIVSDFPSLEDDDEINEV